MAWTPFNPLGFSNSTDKPLSPLCKYPKKRAHFKTNLAIFAHEMKYNTATLDNGLRIIHLPSASPVVYCGYQICVGSRNEAPGEEGLAHFCEHATFKGTQRRRAWNIINALESVGGDLNAYTNKEDTTYHVAVLKEHVGRAIELLTDIVFHSTYPSQELEKEVEVICDEIESYNDSPAELIYDEFENIIFNRHPLGHAILGTAENVRSFDHDKAETFTRKYYRPDNSIFFVYGDVSFKNIIKKLEKANNSNISLSSDGTTHPCQPTDDHAPQPVCPRPLPAGEQQESRQFVVSKSTHQAHVMLGARAYDIHDKRRMSL